MNENQNSLSIFQEGQFENMARISNTLAKSSLIPQGLRGKTEEETAANCFRVVEQAQRWGLSPFAVMDSASVVHGRLMWEGKLIHAAITSSLGVRLRFEYEGKGEQRKVTVTGNIDGENLSVSGTVADWKTSGNGSPWGNPSRHDQMLSYRGSREWARRYAPGVILGVYSPDEFDQSEMRNVTKPEPTAEDTQSKLAALIADPEPEPKPDPEKPKRQKKKRYTEDVTFLDVSAPKTSNGKTWWTAQVERSNGVVIELNTFSTTLGDDMTENYFNGDEVAVVYTQTPKGGFALESITPKGGQDE